MKRSEISCFLLVLGVVCCGSASAQSFTFVPDDTVLSGQLGSEIVFNITITNTSTSTLTLALVRTLNNLPQGWESSMCLDVCYPPTADSVLTTPAFGSSPLNPGESRPFSVHVYAATNHGTGTVRIVARNTHNAADQCVLTFTAISLPTGVETNAKSAASFTLFENYPNPFNPSTRIGFQIADYGMVRLKVYDVLGREVATLLNEAKQPGVYTLQFDGNKLSSGVYFYQLDIGGLVATRRMVLTR